MDTNDKQFQTAYNDLVGAFFRFINTVNPAPTPEAQVSLIYNSLKSLMDTLGNNPCFMNNETEPEKAVNRAETKSAQDTTPVDKNSVDPKSETNDTSTSQLSEYEVKKLSPTPELQDGKYSVASIRLQKPQEESNIDINDYPFILEYTGDEGIFTLNPKLKPELMPDFNFPKEVVEVVRNSGNKCFHTIKAGRIVKDGRKWYIIAPLKVETTDNDK